MVLAVRIQLPKTEGTQASPASYVCSRESLFWLSVVVGVEPWRLCCWPPCLSSSYYLRSGCLAPAAYTDFLLDFAVRLIDFLRTTVRRALGSCRSLITTVELALKVQAFISVASLLLSLISDGVGWGPWGGSVLGSLSAGGCSSAVWG